MAVGEIFSVILMGTASLLCLALIFYLYRITNSVTQIQEDISQLVTEFRPVIYNITEMTDKINEVTEELKQPVYEAIAVIEEIKERVDVIFNMEEKVRNALGANLTGIYNGIRSFFNNYKGNGRLRRTGVTRTTGDPVVRITTRPM